MFGSAVARKLVSSEQYCDVSSRLYRWPILHICTTVRYILACIHVDVGRMTVRRVQNMLGSTLLHRLSLGLARVKHNPVV